MGLCALGLFGWAREFSTAAPASCKVRQILYAGQFDRRRHRWGRRGIVLGTSRRRDFRNQSEPGWYIQEINDEKDDENSFGS
jgi:hypothetical protein